MNGDHRLDGDELLAVLAAALVESDPVPGHVLDAAKAVPELAGLDAELALLTFDSEVDHAGVRGQDAGRQLSFESGPLDVDVVVRTERVDGRLVSVIEGQFAPAASGRVTLLAADPGLPGGAVDADEFGRFRFDDAPAGTVRLLVRLDAAAADARPVVTAWFR